MLILNKYKSPDASTGIFIGRGSPLGNPFPIGSSGDRIAVIHMYRQYLRDRIVNTDTKIISTLRSLKPDSSLVCYCTPKQCHGSVVDEVYVELSLIGMGEFCIKYRPYDPRAEGIDHINISPDSNNSLGVRLDKAIITILDTAPPSSDKNYSNLLYKQLLAVIESDTELCALLHDSNLPLLRYHLKDGLPVKNRFSYWLEYHILMVLAELCDRPKLVIAGSRSVTDYKVVKKAYLESGIQASMIVSGTAKGVDTLGERLANDLNLPVVRFYPYWDMLGKSAGMVRNSDMVKYADAGLILWDGSSTGTHNTIDRFNIANKPCTVINTST